MTTPPSLLTLEALYDAYHRQAIGLAYRLLKDLGEAEDVVQEAFLSVWRSTESYDSSKGSTRTWLLTTVRNRAIDRLRMRMRRPVSQLSEDFDQAADTDVALEAETNVEKEAALRALATLPPAQRQAIELAYFHGLSHTEIAARLLTPVGTIKGRLRLGLAHLRLAFGTSENSPTLS